MSRSYKKTTTVKSESQKTKKPQTLDAEITCHMITE